ncbi:MAG: PAS domain-containing protein, partial [Nostoc sp.]
LQKTKANLLAENQALRDRLAISEGTLQAIMQGEVDALVVSTDKGPQVFTLKSADQSYRLLVEEMQQSAVILSDEELILYCNKSCSNLLHQPLEKLIGSSFKRFLSP